jgi:hypothetical protein
MIIRMKLHLLGPVSPRCARRTPNQPMQTIMANVTTLGTTSNQSGPCDRAAMRAAVESAQLYPEGSGVTIGDSPLPPVFFSS